MQINRDEKMEKYTHAASVSDAEELIRDIENFEAQEGFEVLDAFVRGHFVPNSYKYTNGMIAPGWQFDAVNRELDPAAFRLETRPHGSGSRFGLRIQVPRGFKVPAPWKCIKRDVGDIADIIEIRA